MTRALIATATALIAASTLMSSAAQACLSCEYVPEVVREHATSPLAYGRGDNNVGHGSSYSHEAHVTYSARARFSSRDDDAPKAKKVAKIDRSEKREKVAKVSKPEKSEFVNVAKAEPVEKKATTKVADTESSSITVASVSETKSAAVVTKPKAPDVSEASAKPTDCKKFFASVGMTLTVPCE